jgi:ferric-dicitrate binding protein FerR (iron transport regulator)
MTPDDRLEYLAYLHCRGQLEEPESRELAALLASEPARAGRVLRLAYDEVLFRQALAANAAPLRFRRLRLPILAVAAAAIVLATTLWLLPPKRAWQPAGGAAECLLVANVTGEVLAGRGGNECRPVLAGARLAPGTWVCAGPGDSQCRLELAGQGIEVVLDRESSMIWRGTMPAAQDGRMVELLAGTVRSSVDPARRKPYTVRTEAGYARVAGTQFLVTLYRDGITQQEKPVTRTTSMMTHVLSGVVLVGGLTGGVQRVSAGESATVSVAGQHVERPTLVKGAASAGLRSGAAATAAEGQDAMSAILPAVDFRQASLDQVVEYLNRATASAARPLNLVLMDATNRTPITLQARGASVAAVVNLVAKMAGLDVVIDGDIVRLERRAVAAQERPPRAPADKPLSAAGSTQLVTAVDLVRVLAEACKAAELSGDTAEQKALAEKIREATNWIGTNGDPRPARAKPDALAAKLDTIDIPAIDFKAVSMQDALAFLQATSKAQDPAGEGVNLVLIGGRLASTRVSLTARKVRLRDALKIIAALANCTLEEQGNMVVFRARE